MLCMILHCKFFFFHYKCLTSNLPVAGCQDAGSSAPSSYLEERRSCSRPSAGGVPLLSHSVPLALSLLLRCWGSGLPPNRLQKLDQLSP